MKKAIFLGLFAILGLTSAWAQAFDFSATAPTGQTLYYRITSISNHTVEVSYLVLYTGYAMTSGSLSIPSTVTYSGIVYSVTSIGDNAFEFCTSLTSVTIPNSVTSIGDRAFYGCTSLIEITSNTSIPPLLGGNVFYGVNHDIPVYIPCGSALSYYLNWSCFNHFIEPEIAFSIQVMSSNETMGVVSVIHQSCSDAIAGVGAIPAEGYHFDHWSDGATQNPYYLTVTRDTALVAVFAADYEYIRDTMIVHDTLDIHDTIIVPSMVHDTIIHTQYDTAFLPVNIIMYDTVINAPNYYNIALQSNDYTRGMATGNGRFPEGTEVEIAAVPIEGNRFVEWHDGCQEQIRTITMDTDISLYAIFEPRGTDGIHSPAESGSINMISASSGVIVVKDAVGERVRVFDASGRLRYQGCIEADVWRLGVSEGGTYFVQIADNPAQKVVVID